MNKEEGEKCLKVSKEYLQLKGDTENATKFAQKAYRMNPCDESKQWLDHILLLAPSYTPEQCDAVKTFERRVKGKTEDLYALLEVPREATDADIKKAYRRYALLFHPDKNTAPGSEECFKLISKAFSILSDPVKRKQYDRCGSSNEETSFFNKQHQEYSPFSDKRYFRTQSGDYEFDPDEIFRVFFGGNNPFMQNDHHTTFHFGSPLSQVAERAFTHYNQRRRNTEGAGNSDIRDLLRKLIPALFFIVLSMFTSWYSSYSQRKSAYTAVEKDVSFTPSIYMVKMHQLNIRRGFLGSSSSVVSYWVTDDYQRRYFSRMSGRPIDLDFYEKYLEPAIKMKYIQLLQQSCKMMKEAQANRIKEALDTNNRTLANEIRKERLHYCDLLHEIGG